MTIVSTCTLSLTHTNSLSHTHTHAHQHTHTRAHFSKNSMVVATLVRSLSPTLFLSLSHTHTYTHISNDSTVVATCAGGEVKVWNVGSGQCFRTVPSGYGVCSAFVPGDKHVLVGTKTGELQVCVCVCARAGVRVCV